MNFSFRTLGIFSILFFPSFVLAGYTYQPLLPITMPNGAPLGNPNILEYLKNIYTFGIALVGGLAVIKIVYGGIVYMLSDVVTNKSEAIKEIQAAVVGLLVALGSATLLFTINPKLLTLNFSMQPTVEMVGDGSELLVGADYYANGDVGTVGGKNVGVGGTIAQNSLKGLSFPSTSGLTDAQVVNLVNQYGLANLPLTEADRQRYFPGGTVTAEGYKSLFAAITNSESGFNPLDGTPGHRNGYDVGNTYSEGLLSLSVGDGAVKNIARKYGVSAQEVINNPAYNMEAGVIIMTAQVKKTGSISYPKGYWGPLRRGE
jgi:hypothetical protein